MAHPTHLYPVSVKGVVIRDGRVLLLRNERDEWELPGGKLELGEDPADCAAREIAEESGWTVTTGPLLDAWQYHVGAGADVLILTYGCFPAGGGEPRRQPGALGEPKPVRGRRHRRADHARGIQEVDHDLVRPAQVLTSRGAVRGRARPGAAPATAPVGCPFMCGAGAAISW